MAFLTHGSKPFALNLGCRWGLYRLPCGTEQREHRVILRMVRDRPRHELIPCPYNPRHRPSRFWQLQFLREV